MSASTPKFLDLDAVVPDVDFVIKFKGEEHRLAPTTVETFVIQTQRLEQLSATMTVASEVQLVTEMLKEAFPTVPNEQWNSMTLAQLRKLNEFALKESGQTAGTEEAKKEADKNPQ